MKKFILSISLIIFMVCSQPAMAKTAQFEALSDFSTENPPQMMTVRVITNIQLDENLTLFEGYVLNGRIINVTDPKRLKQNASFAFVPLNYTNFQNETITIKEGYIGRYTTALNTGALVKSAALGVGSHFVKGLSQGVSAIEGAVKNQEGNRLKSTAIALYKDSPLSYVEKGQELIINKGELFLMNFKTKDEELEEEPNYTYKPVETPVGGVAPQVNKAKPILLDDKIPQTTKEFPGEKLESFDNSTHFNPEKPAIESEKLDSNINSLKRY